MKAPALAVIACVLSACASLPPGEDANGLEMKKQSTPVLAALERYQQDHGEYPSSLQLLVPRYLKAVPFDPNLRLDADQKLLGLSYTLAWPRTGSVSCVAPLGADAAWSCHPSP